MSSTAAPRKRIVSLVPSSTETLLSLGADVIACTRFCEQPTIAHVGGTKNPDIAAIIELDPDLVVLDREENRLEDHDALEAFGVDIFVSDVRSLGSALRVVTDLAERAGVASTALLVSNEVPDTVPARRRAFVPIWRRPWMTISPSTYGASLLSHVGIDLIETRGDAAYPTVDLDEVAAQVPDVVLVPSEPYVFKDGHVAELRTRLRTAHVQRIDGQDLFWWGSRTPAAITRLRRALAPPPTA